MACKTNQQKENQQVTPEQERMLIGGTTHEHGCLPSTGETWSELRQTCLRVFDEGIRLNPTDIPENQAVISAFALFNDDHSKVEIFLPSGFEKHNVILPKSVENIYEAQNYKYDAQKGILFIDSVEKYKSADTDILIIYYQPKLDLSVLKQKIKEYRADIRHEYKNFNALAIRIPHDKSIDESIKFFENIKGVLQVVKDQKMELH